MREWLKSQTYETSKNGSLQLFGLLLAALNVITYTQWNKLGGIFKTGIPTLCWDFWAHCQTEVVFSAGQIQAILTGSLIFSILAFLFFLNRIAFSLGFISLLIAFILKTTILLLDFSLYNNTQTLLFLLTFTFLFIPSKPLALKLSLLAFYFLDAIVKLKGDWTTGALLVEVFPVSYKGLEWIAVFSLLLQVSGPLLLFTKQPQYFIPGILTLLTYHGIFISTDQWSAHLPYVAGLLFFLANYIENRKKDREALYQSYIRPEPTKAMAPIVILVFTIIQTVPLFTSLSLNHPLKLMVPKAKKECLHFVFINHAGGTTQRHINSQDFPEHYECHKQVHMKYAQSLCNKMENTNSIQSYFFVRDFKDENFSVVINKTMSCQ